MTDSLIKTFYDQVMLFSANGEEFIENPNIMINEIHKCSGKSKEKVVELFKRLVQIDLLKKTPGDGYAYIVNSDLSFGKIKDLLEE